MKKYRLIYEIEITMSTEFEADDAEDARKKVRDMKNDGKLGLLEHLPIEGSVIRNVEENPYVWDIEEVK